MAIASTKAVEWKLTQLRRGSMKGIFIKRIYTFTKLDSDTSVTIATSIGTTPGNGKIISVIGSGNVVDKELAFTFDVATGIITILNGTTGATAGWIEVTFLVSS